MSEGEEPGGATAYDYTLERASRISPIGPMSPICSPTPDVPYAWHPPGSWILAPGSFCPLLSRRCPSPKPNYIFNHALLC
jgi:hypothetical protein